MHRRHFTLALIVATIVTITGLAFYIGDMVVESSRLQSMVQDFGFLGIMATAFVSSLNLFVPIHPATFAPIFLSAGVSYLALVLCFTIGATAGDSVGYLMGTLGRRYSEAYHPKISTTIHAFIENRYRWILPSTCLYVAFAPLPNEYILIPLALAGIKYRSLFLPLLIGNFFHYCLTVYGYTAVFHWLF